MGSLSDSNSSLILMCEINTIIIKPSWLDHYQVYSVLLFQKDCVVYRVGTINNPTAYVVIISLVVIR